MARIVLAGATAAVCPIREQDQSNLGFVVISRFLVKNYSIAATTSARMDSEVWSSYASAPVGLPERTHGGSYGRGETMGSDTA